MDSTVGRGEVIGVSAATLRRALDIHPSLLTLVVRSGDDYYAAATYIQSLKKGGNSERAPLAQQNR